VLIGNIWSQEWLNRLRRTLRSSGTFIEWYGKPNREWLVFNEDDLAKDGILFKGFKEHQELIQLLARASFGIILAGNSNTEKERPELTYLSLPSRISYLIATAHLPLIVLGDKDSAATQFILENEIGLASSYEPEDFKQVVAKLVQPDQQAYFRKMAARLAPNFSASRFETGLWTSLQTMKPIEFMSQRRTVIVTPNEVNDRHGTGVMVKRLFKSQTDNLISIRSKDDYSGDHQLGQIQIQMEHSGKYRSDIYRTILQTLSNKTIDHIICVPYYEDDLKTAIALKDIYDASLAIYIMDDQNCEVGVISDATMKEALEKADIRFATHGELRDAYENKYRLKFWVLPCVIPQQLVGQFSTTPAITKSNGLLIGSLWSPEWFRKLAEMLKGSSQTVDWFGNHTAFWIQDLLEEHKETVIPWGLISEEELVEKLRSYPYLIIPTGTLDAQDDQLHLTKLSLPGRIIFAAASSGIPIIVVGSAKSSAASFVKRFDLGLVINYDVSEFRNAVASITGPKAQEHFRKKALEISSSFSDQSLLNWLYNSLDLKQPADDRFDRHFMRGPVDLVQYLEPPVPSDIYHDFIPVYQALGKLKIKGYEADFIIDVGCSFGIWSYTASKHYPVAKFYLIDPLMSYYSKDLRDAYQSKLKHLTLGEIALSNQNGKTRFNLAPDLYGSSLMNPSDFRTYEGIEVDVKTLDTYASEQNITGRGILKLDVQCAEHLIVDGAKNFLSQVDAIVIELLLIRYDENSLVYAEMIQLMDQLGYRYFDETGEWRSPQNGVLLQKELLFTRKSLLNNETSRVIQHDNSGKSN
jgi:FkbM family methyltransferase